MNSTNTTVHKYILEPKLAGEYLLSEVPLPKSAKILSVHEQYGKICLWVTVLKEDYDIRKRQFAIVPTGGTVPERGVSPFFVGTVLIDGGDLVFHVFLL